MEIRVLRYFLAVAQEESISAAAHLLHLSQPTLSRQLKELEEELGIILFSRGNRKISLTEEGVYLVNRAKEILSLVDKTTLNLKEAEVVSGDIYIGGGESKAMRLIAKISKELMDEYPEVRIHIYSGNADELAEKLDNGLLDFGIVIDPADKQKYDSIRLPDRDVWGLLMQDSSPLAMKNVIVSSDLSGLPLIVSRQTNVANELANWLGNNIKQRDIVATYNLLYNASLLVSEGVGYAMCLDGLINTTGESDLCFRPLEPRLEAKLTIVWKKNQIHSNAAKKFLERVKSNLK